jgi:plastocyanin
MPSGSEETAMSDTEQLQTMQSQTMHSSAVQFPDPGHQQRTAGRTMRRLAVVALMGMAVTLAACSSGGSATSTTATTGASSTPTTGASTTATTGASSAPTTTAGSAGGGASGSTITIKNFAFSPASVTVAPGATVTVTNKDQVAHTITAMDGKFNTGDIAAGSSKTFTAPNTAGKYPYICSIHQYMTGTLTVS